MAQSSHDNSGLITGINVTPLVDVVLVLLVILMVTAGYIVSKTIPLELPRGATGETLATTLAISVDTRGQAYLDAEALSPARLRERIRQAKSSDPEARAVIAADGRTHHRHVVRVIDLLRQEGVTRFAINIQPEDLVEGNH